MPSSRYSRQSDDNYGDARPRRSSDNYDDTRRYSRQSDDNYDDARRYSRQADDNYDDAGQERKRSSGRSGRVRDVSYSELQSIREQELGSMDRARSNEDMAMVRRSRTQDDQPSSNQDMAAVRRSRTQDDQFYGNDTDSRANRQTGRRDRYKDDTDYDYRRSRRRESAPGYGGRDGAERRSGRSERGSQANDQQVAPYQQKQQQQQQQNQDKGQEGAEEPDNRGFFERKFDRGSDGVITAAAGAALGAITARHFFGPKEFSQEAETRQGKLSKNWKMIGGAVLGATALNLAQNKLKTSFEEQDERNEDMETGMEFVQEMVAGFGPDVL